MQGDVSLLGGILVVECGLSLANLQRAIDARKNGEAGSIAEILLRMELVTSEAVAVSISKLQELQADPQVSKVLVVDDEETICMLLEEMVSDLDIEVLSAYSAQEARRLWTDEPNIVLALLDKNLPDGTGLELLEEFKVSGRNCQLALMSGYANLSSAVEAIQHGVADYIIKPFDMSDVQARVQKLLVLQALRQQTNELSRRLQSSNQHFVQTMADAIELIDAKKPDKCRQRLSQAIAELEVKG